MADGCALPFANANFDAVLLVQVFGGLQDWRRLVDQGRRVLRPDGALILGRTVRPDEGVDARMRQHLVTLLGTLLGTTPERPNTREAAEQYLTAIASTTSHHVAAVWGAECSPRAFLDRHTGGARFLQLSQAVREDVIHALTLWAQTQFGGLDEMFLETYRFEMRVFKFSRG
jgi:SAM-dependent methyltransferase